MKISQVNVCEALELCLAPSRHYMMVTQMMVLEIGILD